MLLDVLGSGRLSPWQHTVTVPGEQGVLCGGQGDAQYRWKHFAENEKNIYCFVRCLLEAEVE